MLLLTAGGRAERWAGGTRGTPRGGAGLWAGPAAPPWRPRPSDQPPSLSLESAGGGSEGHPPLSPPAPAPPPARLRLRTFQETLSTGKGNTGAATEPLDFRKVGPPATQPAGLVMSPEVELHGSAPGAGASAPTSGSATPAGRGEAAALC